MGSPTAAEGPETPFVRFEGWNPRVRGGIRDVCLTAESGERVHPRVRGEQPLAVVLILVL